MESKIFLSGGAIYLVTSATLDTSNASIDISGGAAQNTGTNANSGKGSDGILRVDTASGSVSGSFNLTSPDGQSLILNTAPTSITDPLGSATNYESDIHSSCSYKVLTEVNKIVWDVRILELQSFIIGSLIIFILFQLYKLTWNFIIPNIIRVTKS